MLLLMVFCLKVILSFYLLKKIGIGVTVFQLSWETVYVFFIKSNQNPMLGSRKYLVFTLNETF